MRSGFTLIEVLVAAVIASVAGLALLKTNGSNTLLFTKLMGYSRASEELSLVGVHADKRFNRTTKSLYDILDRSYDIVNDDLRKHLKSVKYTYNETLVDTITFGEEGVKENDESQEEGAEEDVAAGVPLIQFELIRVSIKNDSLHGSILKVRPL
jgi:prepilin-type N-terminal cleavage/methylation domain-containing protein